MYTSKTYLLCVLFGLSVASQALAQDIVGAWTRGDTTKEGSGVVVFFANGYFVNIEHARQSDAPASISGFERGTYTWNLATGTLTVTILEDRNGDAGVGRLSSIPGVTLTVSGNEGTLIVPGFGADTLTRVIGDNPIVGAWGAAGANIAYASVFLPNGVYFEASTYSKGIAHGTYSWDQATSELNVSQSTTPYFDVNGDAGGLSYWMPLIYARVRGDGDHHYLDLDTCCFPIGGLQRIDEAATNYQGMWVVPNLAEAGWGINFAHQGEVIFATWFTYDATGKALWLSMTATKTGEGVYSGTIYQTHGPAFSAMPFSPAAVTLTPVGSGNLTFSDANHGTFTYVVSGITQTKAITQQVFGTLPTCTFGAQPNLSLATNYQDLWYAAPAESEAGWGVNFTHQGDTIFVTWFTYDVDGTPLWLSATAPKTAQGVYSGTLYRTEGPAFSAVPFLPGNVARTSVGTLTLRFANGNSASFFYTVNGVSQGKSITRQVFRKPGTVCH